MGRYDGAGAAVNFHVVECVFGEIRRRNAYEGEQATGSRYVSRLVIASAIIVAVVLPEKIPVVQAPDHGSDP